MQRESRDRVAAAESSAFLPVTVVGQLGQNHVDDQWCRQAVRVRPPDEAAGRRKRPPRRLVARDQRGVGEAGIAKGAGDCTAHTPLPRSDSRVSGAIPYRVIKDPTAM